MPIDFNPEDRVVVNPYFTDTLLSLMRADPEFPPAELRKILRHVGEAIQEFHAKDWLHLGTPSTTRKSACQNANYSADVKPDNIFVNWSCGENGSKTVTDAALGDFGIAYKAGRSNATLDGCCTREFHVAKPRRTDWEWYDKSVRHILVWTGGRSAMIDFKNSC